MKKHLEHLNKNEKLIIFILLTNLLINTIIYYISKDYLESNSNEYINYFYPFVEFHSDYLRGKYENTKLVASYNLPELLVYGLLPIGIFMIWIKLFKTEKKEAL